MVSAFGIGFLPCDKCPSVAPDGPGVPKSSDVFQNRPREDKPHCTIELPAHLASAEIAGCSRCMHGMRGLRAEDPAAEPEGRGRRAAAPSRCPLGSAAAARARTAVGVDDVRELKDPGQNEGIQHDVHIIKTPQTPDTG